MTHPPHCSQTSCDGCPARLVCRCLKISEDAILSALQTLPEANLVKLRQATGAGDGCMACHRLLQRYLDGHRNSARLSA